MTESFIVQWVPGKTYFSADAAADAHVSPRAAAEALGLVFVTDLPARAPSAEFVERIPINFARQHGVLGLAGENGGAMPVVLGDLAAWGQLQVLSRFLGRAVEPLLTAPFSS